ncbi:MAG TPA: cysteine hydrolase family protein [Bacillota bacterium]|nr:cysteine hydrolase family protein [Bacillota bacterium]
MMKRALLIIDMSNDFVHDQGGLSAKEPAQQIVPFIVNKANEYRANGDLVVICMDAHQPNDPHFHRWPVHNVVGTWGQELYGELQNWFESHKEDPFVHYVGKSNYNAFHETNLHQILREAGVQEVAATGVCTDICDFLTLAGADAYGFDTAVYLEGVATFTSNQEESLQHMTLCFHTKIL